jgi:hypothetical protein
MARLQNGAVLLVSYHPDNPASIVIAALPDPVSLPESPEEEHATPENRCVLRTVQYIENLLAMEEANKLSVIIPTRDIYFRVDVR